MKKHNLIILLAAICITWLIWQYENIHDIPSVPMTFAQQVFEIAVFGTMYAALFYLLLLGMYKLIARMVR